jgi:hypothetical protein
VLSNESVTLRESSIVKWKRRNCYGFPSFRATGYKLLGREMFTMAKLDIRKTRISNWFLMKKFFVKGSRKSPALASVRDLG